MECIVFGRSLMGNCEVMCTYIYWVIDKCVIPVQEMRFVDQTRTLLYRPVDVYVYKLKISNLTNLRYLVTNVS